MPGLTMVSAQPGAQTHDVPTGALDTITPRVLESIQSAVRMLQYVLWNYADPFEWKAARASLERACAQVPPELRDVSCVVTEALALVAHAATRTEECLGDAVLDAWAHKLTYARPLLDGPDSDIPLPESVEQRLGRKRGEILRFWAELPPYHEGCIHEPSRSAVDLWAHMAPTGRYDRVLVGVAPARHDVASITRTWFGTDGGVRLVPQPVAELFVRQARAARIDAAWIPLEGTATEMACVVELATSLFANLGVERALTIATAALA